MMKEYDFQAVFNKLKEILHEYGPMMDIKINTEEQYYLDTFKINPINKKTTFFASTMIKKNYVSFHLMPVYACPQLLKGCSDNLKKRMQGKSCFNFKEINEELFKELRELTKLGFNKYKDMDLI